MPLNRTEADINTYLLLECIEVMVKGNSESDIASAMNEKNLPADFHCPFFSCDRNILTEPQQKQQLKYN